MQYSIVLGALAAVAVASPALVLEPRATCPALIGMKPTDAESSLCCIYGQSLAHCCRTKSFEGDAYWSRALSCDSEWFADNAKFSDFYVCQIDPCDALCAPNNVPWIWDSPKVCLPKDH